MSFVKINAIIRCSRLGDVERDLRRASVDGLTVSHVKGYGEYANFYRNDWTTRHARLEIFLPEEDAQRVVEIISSAARTGAAGDGVIAVLPVTRFFHVRTTGPAPGNHERAEDCA